jgi:hypothetical protein
VAAKAEVNPLPDKPFRQPEIMVSVDVAPLRGRSSGARPSAAAPAAAPASVPVAGSTPAVATMAAAMENILAAAAAGKAFTFVQPNPEFGKSSECYEVYKKVTTIAGLEALKSIYFPGTTSLVFRNGAMALSGDFTPRKMMLSQRLASYLWARFKHSLEVA